MKTVSLQLAEQLKEAGIEIETNYLWCHWFSEDQWTIEENDIAAYGGSDEKVLAPTTYELLECLPMGTRLGKDADRPSWYWVGIVNESNAYQEANNPADALARLCLWVQENKDK